jgi:hypothetical protein
MTGHAFQALVTDDELRTALGAIAAALTDDGTFVFETRNPLVREWEGWHVRYSGDVVDSAGNVVHGVCRVDTPVRGDLVSFSHHYTSDGWDEPLLSRSTLRFLDAGTLSDFLTAAGMTVVEQFGDWERGPLTGTSPEIITVARRR